LLFLFYLFGELLLLLEELIEGSRGALAGSFWFECAFSIGTFFLLFFKFPDFSVFVSEAFADLLANIMLFLFEHLNPLFLSESFVLDESLEIEENGVLLGCAESGTHNGSDHLRNQDGND
jgi:hypothetical protein